MTDVVLSCLNEAAALGASLSRTPDGYRVIVADNGSTDGSADVARRHGARVVPVPQPGYGAAVHAGIVACDPADGVVCVMDADGSFDTSMTTVAAVVFPGVLALWTAVATADLPTMAATAGPHVTATGRRRTGGSQP